MKSVTAAVGFGLVALAALTAGSFASHGVPDDVSAAGASGASAHVFGHSAGGEELRAIRLGEPRQRTILVVGSIHGDEREGHEVIGRLRRGGAVANAAVWTVRSANPDGAAARTRTNAHGVDLNRNFPYRWRAAEAPGSGYYQGPRAASEPETRALMRLMRELRPEVTIWYHQPWGEVLLPCHGPAREEKLYARIARMPTNRCRGDRLHGTATSWQEHRVGGTAFVVELDGGELTSAAAARHARAVRRVAR